MSNVSVPSLAILGSCVTRDPIKHIADEVVIAAYQARTCIASMMSPEPAHDLISLVEQAGSEQPGPKFEKRCVMADLQRSWRQTISVECDVLILDFIDERFGVGIRNDEVVTHSTALRDLLGGGTLAARGFKHRGPTSADAVAVRDRALVQLCDELSDLKQFWVNDVYWTAMKDDGTQFENIDEIEGNNRVLSGIYEALAKRTKAQFIGMPRDQLLANSSHRWGPAPYHYTNAAESAIARLLLALARSTLAERQAAGDHSASTAIKAVSS